MQGMTLMQYGFYINEQAEDCLAVSMPTQFVNVPVLEPKAPPFAVCSKIFED